MRTGWLGGLLLLSAFSCGQTAQERVAAHRPDGDSGGMPNAAGEQSSGGNSESGGTAEGGSGSSSVGGSSDTEVGAGGWSAADGLVKGRVVALNEMPVPGAHVRIAGQDVTADEDGFFTATVGAVYDAAVFGEDDSSEQVSIYLGLTRSNPKLYVTPVPLKQGPRLSGVVTGQAPAIGDSAITSTTVFVAGPFMNDPLHALSIFTTDGSFQPKNGADTSRTPAWFGPDQVNGTLFGVQFQTVVLGPWWLSRVGSKSIQVARDGTWNASDGAIELLDIPNDRFVPSDPFVYPGDSDCELVLSLEGHELMDAEECTYLPKEGPHGFYQPPLPAALRYSLHAAGHVEGHTWSLDRHYAGDADEFPVKFPKGVPTAEGPEGALSDADSAVWQLTPAPESIMSLRLTWSDTIEHVALVYSDEKNVSLARLIEAGVQLPEGEAVTWKAQGHLEATSVDHYAAPARFARDARSSVDAEPLESPTHSITYEP